MPGDTGRQCQQTVRARRDGASWYNRLYLKRASAGRRKTFDATGCYAATGKHGVVSRKDLNAMKLKIDTM